MELVELIDVGAGGRQLLGDSETVLDVVVDLVEAIVLALLVAALAVEEQGADVAGAGCLLEHASGFDGVSADVDEHVLGHLY